MCLFLLLVGVVAPGVEALFFRWVAEHIGWGWSFALLAVSTIAGLVLVKSAGLRTAGAFRDAARDAQEGRRPLPKPIANGVLTLVGGVLFLLPGFLSDLIGLLFVLPPTRSVLRRGLYQSLRATPGPGRIIRVTEQVGRAGEHAYRQARGDIVEGSVVEGTVVDGTVVEDAAPPRRSGTAPRALPPGSSPATGTQQPPTSPEG